MNRPYPVQTVSSAADHGNPASQLQNSISEIGEEAAISALTKDLRNAADSGCSIHEFCYQSYLDEQTGDLGQTRRGACVPLFTLSTAFDR
jgi:hypothetical protein